MEYVKNVSVELALLLKNKGFNLMITEYYTSKKYHGRHLVTTSLDYDSDCDAESNWNDDVGSYPTSASEVLCSAPTFGQVDYWLQLKGFEVLTYREELNLHVCGVSYYENVGSVDGNIKATYMDSKFGSTVEAYEYGVKQILIRL